MQVSYWLNRRVTNFCNTFTGGEPGRRTRDMDKIESQRKIVTKSRR